MEGLDQKIEKLEALVLNCVWQFIESAWLFFCDYAFVFGLVCGASTYLVIVMNRFLPFGKSLLFLLVQLLMPSLFFLQEFINDRWLDPEKYIELIHLGNWFFGMIAGILTALFIWRVFSTILKKIKEWLSWLSRDCLSKSNDIIDIIKNKKKFKSWNPLREFKKGKYAIGRGENGKIIYEPASLVDRSSMLVTGCSGSGKTVLVSLILSQALGLTRYSKLRRWFNLTKKAPVTCVIFDPKKDEFLSRVLLKVCNILGLSMDVIDLNSSKPSVVINDGVTFESHEEFHLSEPAFVEREEAADFHNIPEHEEIERFCRFFDPQMSLLHAFSDYQKEHPNLAKRAPSFYAHMRKIIRMGVFNAAPGKGFSIPKSFERGGVVYIHGNVRNPHVKKLMRLLLLRMMQYVESRTCQKPSRIVFFLDEFKHCLNATSLTALQTIRDKGATCIFATQAIDDVSDSNMRTPPEAIKTAILMNTRLKFCFETPEVNNASYLSQLSGLTCKKDLTEYYEINPGLAELKADYRSAKTTEQPYVHQNEFIALETGEGIYFGSGLAKKFYLAPIPVDESDYTPSPTVYESMVSLEKVDVSEITEELI